MTDRTPIPPLDGPPYPEHGLADVDPDMGLTCCHIENDVECGADAEWELQFSQNYMDYSHACPAHVGALLEGSEYARLRRLPLTGITDLELTPQRLNLGGNR